MTGRSTYRFIFILVIVLAALAACTLPDAGQPEAPPDDQINQPEPAGPASQEDPTPNTTPTPEPIEHRIGVRQIDGVGEFYDRETGAKFIPRGSNYVRLDPQPRPDGGTQVYHSVFGPEYYDPEEIRQAFAEMQALGYNTVRVFISQNTIVTDYTLDDGYMQNVIDFLEIAKEYQQYVIFTLDWMPGGKYGEILNQDCCEEFNMFNANTLPNAGLEANKVFFQDFLTYLIEHHAAMDIVFSLQLRNELFYEMDFAPLSLESGVVTGANGEAYDMSIAEDKTRMADEVMVYWIDTLRDAILEVDPTILVSTGFFWPQEPHPARVGDTRYVSTAPAIWETDLDFVDLHPYPGLELNMAQYVDNFGINGMEEKPIIMGEFGVTTSYTRYPGSAASLLMKWQVESCDYGFDGWLLWSWDIYENDEFHSGKSGDSQIAQMLAPANRPDPCRLEGTDG